MRRVQRRRAGQGRASQGIRRQAQGTRHKRLGVAASFSLDGHSGLAAMPTVSSTPTRTACLACKDNDAQIEPIISRRCLRVQVRLQLQLQRCLCFVSCRRALLLVASIILNATHFVRNVSRPASAIIITLYPKQRNNNTTTQQSKKWKMCRHAGSGPFLLVLSLSSRPAPPPAFDPAKCVRNCTEIKIKHDRQFTSSHL